MLTPASPACLPAYPAAVVLLYRSNPHDARPAQRNVAFSELIKTKAVVGGNFVFDVWGMVFESGWSVTRRGTADLEDLLLGPGRDGSPFEGFVDVTGWQGVVFCFG